MGDEPIEYEPCPDCNHCWGPGKEFGDVPTPCYLYMTGSGFVGVCEPANGRFLIKQDDINRCLYTGQTGDVFCSLEFQAANTQFSIRVLGGECFVSVEGPCILESTVGVKHVSVS